MATPPEPPEDDGIDVDLDAKPSQPSEPLRPLDDRPEFEDPADGDGDDVAASSDVSGGVEARDADDAPAPDVAPLGPSDAPLRPHILAFAAGRGGTGRSLLAANVAVYLAQTGKKVVAIDADPAGGSLHLLLGAPRPPRGFGEFLRARAGGLAELIVDTPVAGVGLIGGEGSAFGSTRPKQTAKGILAAIEALDDVDYVVLDLGPPDSTLVLDLWLAADVPVLVTLPDPASIEATYRFVKSGFVRRLRTTRGLDRLVTNPQGPPRAALDFYRAAREGNGPADRLEHELRRYRPRFVVNQTRTLPDLKLGGWMQTAARRRLGHAFEYLGHVESDETVWLAARRRRPLMAEYPEAKVAKNIERIARRVLSHGQASDAERQSVQAGPMRLEEEQTYYEILETEPGVSDEEVRRAYRSLKEIYGPSSPVIAGLYDEQELADLHARANAAHDTLFAPERRRVYDLSLPEADLARAVRAAAGIGGRRPGLPGPAEDRHESPEPVLELGDEVSGAVLRKIRESRGIELGDIAHRTKISERHLRAIEDERFGEMPAAVYVRGYVMEYARAIRIDVHKAVDSYLRRYNARNAPAAPSAASE
ncbi:MAG TPA: helix-turn-helix domain-containing protein [Polyangia bacterium]|jgi:flagellar biosynthesis protein FlhG|nr:helix-turn-helix domain-containing protein [Polyangia bacterium]